MSIIDDNFVEHTDELFLLGRWLPLTPHVSRIWTCRPPLICNDGTINDNSIKVDADYAELICNTMFDGRMTLNEFWKLIGGIEVSPDWINQWNSVAWRTDQEDMGRFNELVNGGFISKIANALIKRFTDCDMHIISPDEFDRMCMLSIECKDDQLYSEPSILLCANWFEFPTCIKIMMTIKGIGFKLLRIYGQSDSWKPDMFVLDLSPEKRLLDKPRDINEFMTYQQHNNFNL